jgi:MFS family permease
MALFVVVPFELRSAGLPAGSHWQVYLPVMLGSFVLMVPPIFLAERRGRQKAVFLGAIGVLLAGQVRLVLVGQSVVGVACSLLLFFAGFNLLEASLPALVSRTAPPAVKGTAIGVYSSVQFLGAFVGASVGGLISKQLGAPWVFGVCACYYTNVVRGGDRMQAPRSWDRAYPVPRLDAKRADGLSRKLADVPGVREAMVMAGEGVAYLKWTARASTNRAYSNSLQEANTWPASTK